MVSFNKSRTRTIIKSWHNSFKEKIVILIGTKGVFFAAICNCQLMDSLFTPLAAEQNSDIYLPFLKKFKKYPIFFLIDRGHPLRYENIHSLGSIMLSNPVEEFINKHFETHDIVAYDIYNINRNENSEVMIASVGYKGTLLALIQSITVNSLKFAGVYFFALEFGNIISKLLKYNEHNVHDNSFQIFISILNVSKIKCIIRHNDNIISIKDIDYPTEKSTLYIQGIIEEEIKDCLIVNKNYITNCNAPISIIFLLDQELQQLLSHTTFPVDQVAILSHDTHLTDGNNRHCFDEIIATTFATQCNFLGLNNIINSIMQINILDKLFFKPFLVIIIILILIITFTQYEILQNKHEISALNTQYEKMAASYRDIKQKYPSIDNVIDLADLYDIDESLNKSTVVPFEILQELISAISISRVEINKVSWVIDHHNTDVLQISIAIKFVCNDASSIDQANADFDEYINTLRARFSTYKITYAQDHDNITSILDHVNLPATIIILVPNARK